MCSNQLSYVASGAYSIPGGGGCQLPDGKGIADPRRVSCRCLTPIGGLSNIRATSTSRDIASHSSSGPGHRPFTAGTGGRTPYGTPLDSSGTGGQENAGIAQWESTTLPRVGSRVRISFPAPCVPFV